jgi:hypothetical protein
MFTVRTPASLAQVYYLINLFGHFLKADLDILFLTIEAFAHFGIPL